MGAPSQSADATWAPASECERHYRVPSRLRKVMVGMYAVCVFSVVLGITEGAALVFMVIIVVGSAYFVWTSAVTLRLGGLRESPSGIANLRPVWLAVRYRREPWENIVRFQSVKAIVFAIVRDGTPWRLVGVAQGSRTTWDGRETRDIVGVLNERALAHLFRCADGRAMLCSGQICVPGVTPERATRPSGACHPSSAARRRTAQRSGSSGSTP